MIFPKRRRSDPDQAQEHADTRRLARLVALARSAVGVERLVPALAPMVGVVLLFAASALLGLWHGLSPLPRLAGLALFALAFVAAGWRFMRFVWPDKAEAMRRLEGDAGLSHQPLSSYNDDLALAPDSGSQALWRAHRKRAADRLAALRAPKPKTDLVAGDPYGLRAAVGIVAFIAVLVGAGALTERLLMPFDFSTPAVATEGANVRLDAWVTPPAYTGRSPLFLSSATQVATADGVRVPEGSVLTVRVQGSGNAELYVSRRGQGEEIAMPVVDERDGVVAQEGLITIDETMAVEVRRGGLTVDGWQFVAEPDEPPTVSVTEIPSATRRNSLQVSYELQDDYGIASASGSTPVPLPDGARPLVEAPEFSLTLPAGTGMRGSGRSVVNLTEHPYAGLETRVEITATDGKGQTATALSPVVRLPSRLFTNPAARAVLEQRQRLAIDARRHMSVVDAFDLLLMVPDQLGGAGAFLAFQSAREQLVDAGDDAALTEMLDAMWELALVLEQDTVGDARRALEAAQERLRQALQDGASEEEIARLTQEVREAMQRFMQALAREAQQNGQQQAMNPNAQEMNSQDLNDILERIEQLSREGRHEEAEALLQQLQEMMENMQMAMGQSGENGGEGMSQESQALDELGRMIQEQQRLMDETLGQQGQQGQQGQTGQGQPGQMGQGQMGRGQQGQQGQGQMGQMQPGQGNQGNQGQMGQGQPGSEGQGMNPGGQGQSLAELQQQHQALRERLEELLDQLERQGYEPNDRLGDAGDAMGEAGDELGEQNLGGAAQDQANALDALREGAQGMAQQMAEGQQPGQGEGMGPAETGEGRDPLGRAGPDGRTASTRDVGIPDEIDTQRAREILRALRDRLDLPDIPRLQRDYLERLLP
ncbi:MAG: TIGR02302 family protein [Pseudomonadota bacterium]